MMKPESSSTAYSAFSMSESRETSRKSACEATARTNSGDEALALELGHARPRVAVRGVHVRVALVVEVVQHPDEAPFLLVAAEAGGVRAHRRLDREHVLAQGGGLGPLAEKGPGVFARKRLRHGCYPSPPLDHGEARHRGRVPLSGTIQAAGNKNAALPLLAASLLTEERVEIANVPRIRDTEAMLTLLADLGVAVERLDDNKVALTAANIATTDVDPALAERIRASFLVAGPLLARFGSALMPPPGGDVIGRRRLDPHLDAFRALGAEVDHDRHIKLRAPNGGLRWTDFFMDEPSVMGIENALMAAALTQGTTVIRNAASEPHVQDLARMLNKMGAAIEGIGSNVMYVHGMGAGRLRALGLAGPHRDRLVHGARGRDRRGAADQGLRARGHADDLPRLRAARAALEVGRRGHRGAGRPEARRGARRGRLPVQGRGRARGRRSRPTSRRSRWRSPRSPRARS